MTLTELLVATAMVGVIIVGVMSADYAIRRMQNTSSSDYYLTARASSVMLHLTRDALRAVGDAGDQGIEYDDTGAERGICFRYDDQNTPEDYSDVLWNCYNHDASLDLYRSPGLAAADFTTYTDFVLPLCPEAYNGHVAGDFFEVHLGGGGQIEAIDFFVISVMDQSQAVDPVRNPVSYLTSSVTPAGFSQ